MPRVAVGSKVAADSQRGSRVPRVAGGQQRCTKGWHKIKYVPRVIVDRKGVPEGWQEE